MSETSIQVHEQLTLNGKILVISVKETIIKARVEIQVPSAATFYEFQGQPFDAQTVCDPSLLLAESFLQNRGYTFFEVAIGTEPVVPFPTTQSLSVLPIRDENMTLLYEADRYDGPISGLVEDRVRDEIFWFDWCMDSGHNNGGRVYSLRLIPVAQYSAIREWINSYDKLNAELLVVGNSQIWPISEKQKSQLRAPADIQTDIDSMQASLPTADLRSHLITAWMPECMEELAAIRVVWMSREESARFQVWQKDVAKALANEDQQKLDSLFSNPAGTLSEFDLFKVLLDVPGGVPRIVARDHRGQALGENFWLTANHRINDLTYLVEH